MRTLVITIGTLLLAAAAPARQAVDAGNLPADEAEEIRRYTVEVIVFSYAEDISTGTEIFLPDVVTPLIEGAPVDEALEDEERTDEDPRQVYPFDYVLLEPEEFTLSEAYSQLDLLDAYQPLMHFGWTQPTIDEDQTPALVLERFGVVPDGLGGTIKLFRSRYLHLAVDLSLAAQEARQESLQLSEPDSPRSDRALEQSVAVFGDDRIQNSDADGAFPLQYAPLRYRLTERRIMKNGEIRYFDHPRFGVIAKVSRVAESAAGESFLP